MVSHRVDADRDPGGVAGAPEAVRGLPRPVPPAMTDRFDDPRFRRVYHRLRSRARQLMAAERVGHTLEPTGLVHEMFIRVWRDRRRPRSPEELLGAAAVVMRRILVEWARRRGRVKRGGHLARVDIAPEGIADPLGTERIVAVDRALDRLAKVDPEAAHVAVLRHFGGLTVRESALVIGVSPRTVDRLWAFAVCWLHRELGD